MWKTRSISHISCEIFSTKYFQPNNGERALMMANGWRHTGWDLVPHGLQSKDPTRTAALAMICDKEQSKTKTTAPL